MIAEPQTLENNVSAGFQREPDYLTQLDQALTQINAPIHYRGPNILAVGGLLVKQLFTPLERKLR